MYLRCAEPHRAVCKVDKFSIRRIPYGADFFFADTLVTSPPQIASSSFAPSIACSASSGIHSDSHSESTHAFAPPREVATRRFRRPIADIGHVKGWFHWRLLGALITRDARAAYSRRIVAPSSSLRPLPLDRAAPAPLCSAQAIDLIQSITHSSALSLRAVPPRPLVHLAAASPCSEKKMGLEVRDMRRCPCLGTAPLGCRSARAGCKRSRLR